uniref:MICOS complex subunit MIC13 n=1 Tax=Felis catus TaxID=9685 RepID=A0ABI7ZTP1_FELCA
GDYVSQRPLRRRHRKRRASRVSLRAEPRDHGAPSVVADEVRGAAGRARSPRKSPRLWAPPPVCSRLDLRIPWCQVPHRPDGETEVQAGRGFPRSPVASFPRPSEPLPPDCLCPRPLGASVASSVRFLIKGSVAGGAVYLVYDQELLGPSDKSQAVLQKAEEVVPPALYQFSQYVCEQTGLKIPQLPAPPKFNFHIRDSWNSGIIKVMSALSAAPSKACEYSREGWDYLKERIK